jgi:hypothetical protein
MFSGEWWTGIIIIGLFFWLVPMFIASRMAYKRGRSRGGSVAIAGLFGWLALPFLACMRTDWQVVNRRKRRDHNASVPLNIIGPGSPGYDADTAIDMRDYNERRHRRR